MLASKIVATKNKAAGARDAAAAGIEKLPSGIRGLLNRTPVSKLFPQKHSITNFVQEISNAGGPARQSKYIVTVNPPWMGQAGPGEANNFVNETIRSIAMHHGVTEITPDLLSFMCLQGVIPGKSLATNDITTLSFTNRMPYNTIFEKINLQFLCRNDGFIERRFFDAWMNCISNPGTGNFNYISEYSSSIYVSQLDENHNKIYTIKLIKAFPVMVAEQTIDAGSDAPHNLGITFTYERWVNDDLDQFGKKAPADEFEKALGNAHRTAVFLNNTYKNIKRVGSEGLSKRASSIIRPNSPF
jgi:hypothetical protein